MGTQYGLHPSCAGLQTFFGENKLALLFNTGTLVYPTHAQLSIRPTASPLRRNSSRTRIR